jgi:hypothetical protein
MASRRKRASRVRDVAGIAGEQPPLPGWREVVRRPAFRASAVRQALPVIGVLFLRWPPLDIVVFFLLEVWLFLTLRVAFEVTFDRRYVWEFPARRIVAEFLRYALLAGAAFAVMIVVMMLITVLSTFPTEELVAFLLHGWRTPSFLLALALMVASHLWEARRFALHCRTRSPEEAESDVRRMHVMLARLMVVALAGIFIGIAQAFGWGGPLLVLVISGAIVWLEAAPERAEALLGFTPRRS